MSKLKTVLIATSLFMLLFCSFSAPYLVRGESLSSVSSKETGSSENTEPVISTFPTPQQNMTLSFDRNVTTNSFLYTIVRDEIYLKNEEDRLFNGIRLFYPIQSWEQMENPTFKGVKEGKTRNLVWESYQYVSGYLGLQVHFPWYIEKGESVNVTFHSHIPNLGRIYTSSQGSGEYAYTFSVSPRFLHPVESVTSWFHVPKEGNALAKKCNPLPEGSPQNKALFDESSVDTSLTFDSSVSATRVAQELEVYWKIPNLPIKISYFSRKVRYKLSHKLTVKEEYVISPVSLPGAYQPELQKEKMEIGVFKNAKNLTVKDESGELQAKTIAEKERKRLVEVQFRVPLRPGSRYSFTVSYTSNETGDYLGEGYPDKRFNFQRNLSLPLTPLINASVQTGFIQFSLPSTLDLEFKQKPPGLHLEDSTSTTFMLFEIGKKKWTGENIAPYQPNIQVIIKGYPTAYLRIFGRISLIIFFIFAFILFLSRLAPSRVRKELTPEAVKKAKERSRLSDYIQKWERYTALEDKVDEEIGESIQEKGKGRNYKELQTAANNLEERRENLYARSEELKKNPRLKDVIRKLEKVGSEIAVTRSMILQRWRKQINQEGERIGKAFRSYVTDLLASLNSLRVKRDKHVNSLKDRLITHNV